MTSPSTPPWPSATGTWEPGTGPELTPYRSSGTLNLSGPKKLREDGTLIESDNDSFNEFSIENDSDDEPNKDKSEDDAETQDDDDYDSNNEPDSDIVSSDSD